jgi:hypothetical protein
MQIPGYEGLYEVNDQGEVRRSDGTILIPHIGITGEMCVTLIKDGIRTNRRVSSLMNTEYSGVFKRKPKRKK